MLFPMLFIRFDMFIITKNKGLFVIMIDLFVKLCYLILKSDTKISLIVEPTVDRFLINVFSFFNTW